MMKEMGLIIGGAALVLACDSPKAPVQGVTTTGAGVVSNQDTVERLTEARCERAAKCNEFGTGKDYADMEGCKSEVSHDLADDYKPSSCPHGANEARLTSCINQIRNSACGNLADSIKRGEACRRVQICID